jgi:hypothetical protein
MTGEDRNGVQINHVHSGAICTEIGERLQTTLKVGATRLPSHLKILMKNLLDSVGSCGASMIATGLGRKKEISMSRHNEMPPLPSANRSRLTQNAEVAK